jgi:hypothetical protein
MPLSASGLIWYFDAAELAKFSAPARVNLATPAATTSGARITIEFDASLLKRVTLTERMKLEVRADATNLTNSVAFGPPDYGHHERYLWTDPQHHHQRISQNPVGG